MDSVLTCNNAITDDPINCDSIGFLGIMYNDLTRIISANTNKCTGSNTGDVTFNMTAMETSLNEQILPLLKKEFAGIDVIKYTGISNNNIDIDTDSATFDTIITDYNAMKLAIDPDVPSEVNAFMYYEERVRDISIYQPVRNIKKIRIQNIDRTSPICINKITITLAGVSTPQSIVNTTSYSAVTVIYPDIISNVIDTWVYNAGSASSGQYLKTLSGFGQYIEFTIDPTLRINKVILDSSFIGAGNESKLLGTNLLAIDTSNTIVCDISITDVRSVYEFMLYVNRPSINEYVYNNKFRGDITKQVSCNLYDTNAISTGINGSLIQNGCYCKTGYKWNNVSNKCMSCKSGTDIANVVSVADTPTATNQPIGNGCYCATNHAWDFDSQSCVSCINASNQIDASTKCASVALGTNNIQGILNNHPGKSVSDAYWELYNKLGTSNIDQILANHRQTWEVETWGRAIPMTVSGAYWTLMRMLYIYKGFVEGIGLKAASSSNTWVFTSNLYPGEMTFSRFDLWNFSHKGLDPFTFFPTIAHVTLSGGPSIYTYGQ